MEELWLNWSHLGVDESTKVNNITKLVQIEKELHKDVVSETRQKLITMQGQVDSKFTCIIIKNPFICPRRGAQVSARIAGRLTLYTTTGPKSRLVEACKL